MQNKVTTVAQYLAELPLDRRAALGIVRAVLRDNLDPQVEEGMQYGMIGYYVPHSVYPAGYHCDPRQPLPYAGLASQKSHMSLYLMALYGAGGGGAPHVLTESEKWFRAAWAATGKKLDMGKCCIRFKRVEDLALDAIAGLLRRVPARAYLEHYEATRRATKRAVTVRKTTRKSTAASRAAGAKTTGRKPTARTAARAKTAKRTRRR